jgi:hypothetical protein
MASTTYQFSATPAARRMGLEDGVLDRDYWVAEQRPRNNQLWAFFQSKRPLTISRTPSKNSR